MATSELDVATGGGSAGVGDMAAILAHRMNYGNDLHEMPPASNRRRVIMAAESDLAR